MYSAASPKMVPRAIPAAPPALWPEDDPVPLPLSNLSGRRIPAVPMLRIVPLPTWGWGAPLSSLEYEFLE